MDNGLNWRTASYSGSGGGNCVEVADADGRMLVRDTKDREGVALAFTASAWSGLVADVKDGKL